MTVKVKNKFFEDWGASYYIHGYDIGNLRHTIYQRKDGSRGYSVCEPIKKKYPWEYARAQEQHAKASNFIWRND